MASGGHLMRDLPEIVERAREANPGVIVRQTRPIGEVDALLAAIPEWIIAEDELTKRATFDHPSA